MLLQNDVKGKTRFGLVLFKQDLLWICFIKIRLVSVGMDGWIDGWVSDKALEPGPASSEGERSLHNILSSLDPDLKHAICQVFLKLEKLIN